MLVGTHERQLDDKGRLALPASFRADLQGNCYLAFGTTRCITIYPAAAFEARANEMIEQVKRGELSENRLRAVAGSAALVSIDKQGRITVDERLREYAQLDVPGKVVVAGRFDQAEIWDDSLHRSVAEAGEGEMAGPMGMTV